MKRRRCDTYGGELGRRGRVESVVGGRVLVEQRRQVHYAEAVESSASVQRPNLRSDPAYHEVLENLSH